MKKKTTTGRSSSAVRRASEHSLHELVLRWRRTAKRMHKMGVQESNRFNPAGGEYMQTAAAYRLCANQLAAEIRKAQR